MRELTATLPVKAPSGFALAFLNTYIRDLGGGTDEATLPLHYTFTQFAGITLERDVSVTVDYVPTKDAPAVLRICWEPDKSLFPSFDGTMAAEADGERACRLTITGSYDAPGGVAGQLFDAVIGVRIAQGTLDTLLVQFRDAIEADYKKRMEYA